MAAYSKSSAVRQTVNTVNSEADHVPLHPIPNYGVDDFILKAGNYTLVPEIADENGTLRVSVDPKYLPRPRVPQAPVVAQVTVPSRVDKLYEEHFRRLERDLEARSSRLPAFVNEGNVATLSLVTVSAVGEAAFESTLEDRVTAPAK